MRGSGPSILLETSNCAANLPRLFPQLPSGHRFATYGIFLADGFGIEHATPSAISLDLESEKAKVGEAAAKAGGLCSLLANGNE